MCQAYAELFVYLILTVLWIRLLAQFTDKETEAHEGLVFFPWSHSQQVLRQESSQAVQL